MKGSDGLAVWGNADAERGHPRPSQCCTRVAERLERGARGDDGAGRRRRTRRGEGGHVDRPQSEYLAPYRAWQGEVVVGSSSRCS